MPVTDYRPNPQLKAMSKSDIIEQEIIASEASDSTFFQESMPRLHPPPPQPSCVSSIYIEARTQPFSWGASYLLKSGAFSGIIYVLMWTLNVPMQPLGGGPSGRGRTPVGHFCNYGAQNSTFLHSRPGFGGNRFLKVSCKVWTFSHVWEGSLPRLGYGPAILWVPMPPTGKKRSHNKSVCYRNTRAQALILIGLPKNWKVLNWSSYTVHVFAEKEFEMLPSKS